MLALRLLLVVLFGVVLVYTGIVGATHGWNVLTVFLGDIAAMNWSGSFNLDFTCYLLLAALWVAWRSHFSPAGLALGVLAALGGTLVLAPYLIYASVQAGGDVKALLIGKRRAAS